MIRAGIKETKNNLSRYLVHVKAGEDVIITDRGKPIARIISEEGRRSTICEALAPLSKQGIISLPSRRRKTERLVATHVSGKPVSEMVIEDRR